MQCKYFAHQPFFASAYTYLCYYFAVGDDKKNGKPKEGKGKYTKLQVGYISAIW